MPVELPWPEEENASPAPPSPIVWLIVFVLVMLAGAVSTLLSWPKGQPTGTPWFWVRLLVLPASAGGLIYGLRLYYYQQEMDRLEAEAETLAEDTATAIRFAREPLAVLDTAYLCATGSRNLARHVAEKNTSLESRQPTHGNSTVRHTALALADDSDHANSYRSCFVELLEQLDPALCRLPSQMPLEVFLQLPEDARQNELSTTWQICWEAFGHRPVAPVLLTPDQGFMALDTWLDADGGPALEKCALVVSVQLHNTPPENSAEAAVALLLAWAPLAQRKGLVSLAQLHRPVEAAPDGEKDAASRALLWGMAAPAEVSDLWQGGLARADKSALTRTCADLALAVSDTDELSGIHDIDVAIGDAGVASAWLAMTLAIEHAASTGKPQLVGSRQNTLRLAVVQPAADANNARLQA
jgi:hypothetical protein